jgi:hypothetical protein
MAGGSETDCIEFVDDVLLLFEEGVGVDCFTGGEPFTFFREF